MEWPIVLLVIASLIFIIILIVGLVTGTNKKSFTNKYFINR